MEGIPRGSHGSCADPPGSTRPRPLTDADGLADARDLCPDSPAGAKVNELGCQPDKGLVLEGVQFKSGTAELEPEVLERLSRLYGLIVL